MLYLRLTLTVMFRWRRGCASVLGKRPRADALEMSRMGVDAGSGKYMAQMMFSQPAAALAGARPEPGRWVSTRN